jgi:hypothetical protein
MQQDPQYSVVLIETGGRHGLRREDRHP